MLISFKEAAISCVVITTKMSSMFSIIASRNYTFNNFIMQIVFGWYNKLVPIYRNIVLFSFLPYFIMVIVKMLRLIIYKLQVCKPIIIAYTIQMMNFFIRFKRPTYKLFHDISMFQNSFSINCNSPISIIVKTALFNSTPVRIILGFSIQIYKSLMTSTVNISRISAIFSTIFNFTNHDYIIQHEGYKYND